MSDPARYFSYDIVRRDEGYPKTAAVLSTSAAVLASVLDEELAARGHCTRETDQHAVWMLHRLYDAEPVGGRLVYPKTKVDTELATRHAIKKVDALLPSCPDEAQTR